MDKAVAAILIVCVIIYTIDLISNLILRQYIKILFHYGNVYGDDEWIPVGSGVLPDDSVEDYFYCTLYSPNRGYHTDICKWVYGEFVGGGYKGTVIAWKLGGLEPYHPKHLEGGDSSGN